MREESVIGRFIRRLFLLIVLFFTAAPLALLVSNAVKTKLQVMTSPFSLPTSITFESLKNAWIQAGYAKAYFNSFIVGIITIAIVCLCAGLTAYALARMNFKGKNVIIAVLLVIISVPVGIFLVPIFFLYVHLKLINTLTGIIIIYSATSMPFNIFLLRTFFLGVPKELSESAFVDGLNHWRIFWKIYVPISKPVFLTVAIVVGLGTWNEFFFANALLQREEVKTVATRYLSFTGNFTSDWNMISAAGLITILPIIAAYILLQEKFISGITEGSIKG